MALTLEVSKPDSDSGTDPELLAMVPPTRLVRSSSVGWFPACPGDNGVAGCHLAVPELGQDP